MGVFDGHCGAGAAEEAVEIMQDSFASMVTSPDSPSPYVSAFLATDDRIEDEAGCTATCVTIFQQVGDNDDNDENDESDDNDDNDIVIRAANVGDSMAYLTQIPSTSTIADTPITPSIATTTITTTTITTLTQDHRVTNPDEQIRLQSHGVIPEGEEKTTRLYGLNIARSLGDRFLKDEDLGLSAEPYVSDIVTLRGDQEALIVIASDGLWDVMSVEDAIDMARHVDRDSRGGVVNVAVALVEEAVALGSKDDVTVVVCRVWTKDFVCSFSGGFEQLGSQKRQGVEDGEERAERAERAERGGDSVEDSAEDSVEDDLAVGFGNMLL